ncbi:FMRFamide receptor-like [Biomphalaria glabrata]|uniref:FMRFamide receptor-like n=1 Tax=Biomphalaria glabrata TaxID=6526 RepID=A0A9W3AWA7_BIOGL|nr:FMRFamide receptor-like [Biomphalaria glabrata]
MMTELFTSGPYTCGEYDPTTAGFDKDSLNLTGEEINLFCGVRNFYGISSALISLLGLVGNTFCLILLPKTGGAKSAIILLFTLGLYDIVFLVSSMFLKAIPSLTLIGHSTVVVSNVLSPAIFPLFLTAHLGAIYTTAAISVERCLAITAPFRTRQWLTSRRIKLTTLVILFWSISFNLPRFLFLQATDYWEPYLNRSWIRLEPSSLSENVEFLNIYFAYLNTTFKFVIPILLVIISNMVLLCCLRHRRNLFVRHVQVNGESCRSAVKDGRVTPMVLAVTWAFVLSHVFAVVQVFLNLQGPCSSPQWCITFNLVCDFIFLSTSATNFLLYYAFGKKFRKLVQVFFSTGRCGRARQKSFRMSSRSSRSRSV